jgi:hypothetical protein
MTHSELCDRALRWLRGTRHCQPVFNNVASCSEIPDAIGWSSSYKHRGSTVVECKSSRSDFYADKKKRIAWRDPRFNFLYSGRRMSQEQATAGGYTKEEYSLMGDYRFYLCLPGVVVPEMLGEHAPNHGLLWLEGSRVRIVHDAPRREDVNYPAEIRYLRFAIINRKRLYTGRTNGLKD